MDLAARLFEMSLAELAADAPAHVDELAVLAKERAIDPEAWPQIRVASRPPIRVALLQFGTNTAATADVMAIAAIPGAPGLAVRWRRDGTTVDARDQYGSALKHIPEHQKIIGLGDGRMLLTSVLRTIQRPAPALVYLGGGVQVPLLPETTLGRTSLSDIVIPDGRLTKVAWTYEWSDDEWWARAGKGGGNITLNGEQGWERRELKHDDVVASGLLAVRFLLAH